MGERRSTNMLDWPEHRIVCPNSTSVRFTVADLPAKESVTGVREAAAETVMVQAPLASAVHGLDGATVAPAGRPDSEMDSPGAALPQILAGVTPPRQASEDASTMCEAKTQPSGPHAVALQAAAEAEHSAAAATAARSVGRIVAARDCI